MRAIAVLAAPATEVRDGDFMFPFANLEEVREAVDAFVKRYNAHWRLEKLGFQTPLEARQAALRQEAA